MSAHRFPILAALAPLALAGCQTTDGDDWVGRSQNVSFKQAEATCGELRQEIEKEANRPGYFVSCMEALGWTPKPGTEFAAVRDARDPA